MKTIHKYELQVSSRLQLIPLPAGANILHVANQNEVPMMWAEVEASDPGMVATSLAADVALERRGFVCVSTGGKVPSEGTYLGTVIVSAGRYVWHFYEVKL